MSSRTSARAPRPYRPQLEILEERRLPAINLNVPFRVNSLSDGNQVQAANASNAAGASVVVWAHVLSSRNSAIRAQVLSPEGTRVGREISVTRAALPRFNPRVALDGAGNFVVAWQENNNIVARRYTARGTPRGAQFTVAASPSRELDPDVASDGAGNFIIAYNAAFTNRQVLAAMYNARGARLRTVIVTQGTGDTNSPVASSIAATTDGRFGVGVAATTRVGSSTDATMTVHRFTAAGRRTGSTQFDQQSAIGAVRFACDVSVDNRFNLAAGWQIGSGVTLGFASPTGAVQSTRLVFTIGDFFSVARDLTSNHAVITWGVNYAFTNSRTVFIAEYSSDGTFFSQFPIPGPNSSAATSAGKDRIFLLTYVAGLQTTTGPGSQVIARYRQFVVNGL
jgi:hypothetical protein